MSRRKYDIFYACICRYKYILPSIHMYIPCKYICRNIRKMKDVKMNRLILRLDIFRWRRSILTCPGEDLDISHSY